jgi:hypothetical protein
MLHTEGNGPAENVILLDDAACRCAVTCVPRFLAEAEADALFAVLRSGTPFHAEAPVMFGRPIEVRRRTYSFGEPGTRYRYSDVERVAAPWPAELVPAVERERTCPSPRSGSTRPPAPR